MSTVEPTQTKPFISPWWALYIAAVIAYPAFFIWSPPIVVEEYGQLTPFVLQDHQNTAFHLGQDNRPMIVNFIFTRCQDVCPLLSTKMALLQDKLDIDEALLISITVDPNYDTPSVLTEYATRYNANPAQWLFLTGTEQQIRNTVDQFQQYYEITQSSIQDSPPNIMHSEKFILVDEYGYIRGFFDDDPQGINALLHSISHI